MNEYKGLSNYATWLVYKTILGQYDKDSRKSFVFEDDGEGVASNPKKVVKRIKEYCYVYLEEWSDAPEDDPAMFFAEAFFSQVDWPYIAQKVINEFQEEVA